MAEVEARLFDAAPEAAAYLSGLETERPPAPERTLELPISIYGGG